MPDLHDDDVYEDEYEDEEDEDTGSYLYDYAYKPFGNFIGPDGNTTAETHNKLFLGIELEVKSQTGDRRYDVDTICHKHGKYVYLKKDGSLSENNGFEIVTYPLTPVFAKKFLPELCQTLNKLSIKGHSAGDGYGMHVHFSTQPLTRLHKAKLVVFYSSENTELLTYVAQRADAEWCEIKDKGFTTDDLYDDDKYQALNINNGTTYEVRIFRSNTLAERVLKNIEFVLATIEFTRGAGCRELTTDCFLKWLKNNRKEYPNLYRFLAEKDGSSDYAGRYANVLNHRRAKRATNA